MNNQKPSSYCSISILNDNNEITNTLNDCYFKYTYKWIKSGIAQSKMLPYLATISLIQDDKEIKDININKIVINNIYSYDKNKNKISIFDIIMDKYEQVCKLYGEKLEFPVPRILEYID